MATYRAIARCGPRPRHAGQRRVFDLFLAGANVPVGAGLGEQLGRMLPGRRRIGAAQHPGQLGFALGIGDDPHVAGGDAVGRRRAERSTTI